MILLVVAAVILLFGFLVFIHELGHFVAARRNGVEVEEFGFGFPPKVWGRQVGRTEYSINWLPLGGFVRMKGEDQDDNSTGSFMAANFWAKTKILFAGVTMNLLTAYLILLGLCLTGLPPLVDHQASYGRQIHTQAPQLMVVTVGKDTPAAQAGIAQGDIIVSANGKALSSADGLVTFTKRHAGETVTLTWHKQGQPDQTKQITLRKGGSQGYLGVTPYETTTTRYGFIDAAATAALLTVQLTWATLQGFANLISGLFIHARVSDQVTGPVGIVALLTSSFNLGWAYLLTVIASISLSLAVINALPLPALDGGRWTLLAAAKLRGKPLSPKLEAGIHAAGFAALILLMLIVTVVDVGRLI